MNYLAHVYVKRYETSENTKFVEKDKAKEFFVKNSVEFLTSHNYQNEYLLFQTEIFRER